MSEIAEIDALRALVADFSGDGEGLGVVRDGFVVLALGLVDVAEIAEMDTLTALVADFSGDGDGLGVVDDGFVVMALGIVDVAEIAEIDAPHSACRRFLGRWRWPGCGARWLRRTALIIVDDCRDCRERMPSERLSPISRAMARAWV